MRSPRGLLEPDAVKVARPVLRGPRSLRGHGATRHDTEVTKTDIDHMVPLAEAWDSGASQWTKQRRVEYANYLGDDRHLVAVSQRSNRQKSDQDVTTWIVPDNPSQRCRYLSDQVAVKLGWNLSVDPAEQAAMRDIAGECPGTEVTVNPVP
ncbi:HNH endonuclease family protein [Streptomyces spongiae]|uniref:HNH endonuclease n=1 Tax=Streptomyces spongiae TaxID=565072 RepID=A0A5N8XLI7_9ACTN|nr:HNH endonuclease family protein [Streptomyces spongiae]MPY60321.1 HNH endonuclease [Streptomyces spongiae]